jgi:hypothetical protein
MSFEQNINKWITIDDELKNLNKKINALRAQKNDVEKLILNNSELTELTDKNITIKINDEKLKFVQVKETQPLTFKYLETCLGEIIKSEDQVKKIIEYIKNKREIKYSSEIKRFSNN